MRPHSIRNHPVFKGLQDDELVKVCSFFEFETLSDNQWLLQEGKGTSSELYLVVSGQLEIVRRVEESPGSGLRGLHERGFNVAVLSEGDAFGELSFVDGGYRSASVRCITNAKLLKLSKESYQQLEGLYPKLSGCLMRNLVGVTGRMLKKTTDNEIIILRRELEGAQMQSKSNLFFSYVIGLLCVYNLAIQQLTSLSMDSSRASLLSAAVILIFCGALALMIHQSKLPIQFFGLTTRNWKKALGESAAWSFALISVLVVVKWMLIMYVPRYHYLEVFSFDFAHTRYLAFNFILYGLHSPLQEFIVRGVLQGSLQRFFKGRNVTFRAILISNAIFSATHVHLLGGLFGAIVFVPGLFWGWMYARHQNLIGVSLSHMLIGWAALFFLSLESLF